MYAKNSTNFWRKVAVNLIISITVHLLTNTNVVCQNQVPSEPDLPAVSSLENDSIVYDLVRKYFIANSFTKDSIGCSLYFSDISFKSRTESDKTSLILENYILDNWRFIRKSFQRALRKNWASSIVPIWSKNFPMGELRYGDVLEYRDLIGLLVCSRQICDSLSCKECVGLSNNDKRLTMLRMLESGEGD
jgi:hypothetical protein